MGKFFFTLTAALAEMERGLIGERTKTALARKKERGEVYGEIPYGFDRVDGALVANKKEQVIIAMVKKLRGEGMSYQGIADHLNGRGIPTKKGFEWTRAQVNRLQNAS